MNIRIKRIDQSLPLPQYQTPGSVCFDLYSRIDLEIAPKSLALIPCNFIIETPKDFMLILVSRSSTPRKKGLLIPHGIGIIDQDYRGDTDEIQFQVYNYTENLVAIGKGERLAQGCFVPISKVTFSETMTLESTNRGGFGSTDST